MRILIPQRGQVGKGRREKGHTCKMSKYLKRNMQACQWFKCLLSNIDFMGYIGSNPTYFFFIFDSGSLA